ncbi:peroxisomal sarcosine oxidase-like [Amphiura filiformis]|uniref:peroxisomal sarcosine oxidase-like n=1 Tax=Amphiura filiformis TaxID=82378 RepID=UPI003B21AE18
MASSGTGMGDYDCLVVGAGIEGCATAYQLAKRKYKTLLLEQFPLPHSRGSSHGHSRAARYAYHDKIYADMMREAFPMWYHLEQETNTTLYRQTGLLILQEPSQGSFEARLQTVKDLGLQVTQLNGEDLNKLYSGVQYSNDHKVFLEHKAGVLMANKCLTSLQNRFIHFGGKIHSEEQMREIIPGNMVRVRTNKGEYRAKSVILTVGPWAGQVMKPLGLNPPLKTWRMNVCYFKEKQPGTFPEFPIFAELACNNRYIIPNHKWPGHLAVVYGLPAHEYPGMYKMGYYTGNEAVPPDERDKFAQGVQWDIRIMQKYVRDHFPGLEDEPAIIEQCMYTKTPDEHFILDKHPVYPNIVFGCGFSGHGFKLAPVIGKILCELAMGLPQSYDLQMFSLKRFDKQKRLPAKL